jgi:hypothetical protein
MILVFPVSIAIWVPGHLGQIQIIWLHIAIVIVNIGLLVSIITIHHIYISYIYIIVYYNIPFKGLVPFANFCSWHQEGKRLLPAAVAEMSTVSSGDGLLGPIRDDRPCFVTRVRRATGWKQPENIINKYKKRDKGWLDGW